MGAWSTDAFGNDDACDWAGELEGTKDFSVLEHALANAAKADTDYLEAPDGAIALAAIEVMARLKGHWGEINAYTENVDKWVKAHTQTPTTKHIDLANAAIQRILADNSELKDLWQESDDFDAWIAAVQNLKERVNTPSALAPDEARKGFFSSMKKLFK